MKNHDKQTPGPNPEQSSVTTRKNQRLALLALAVMALVWGYNWVVMKKVMAYVGAYDFSALRTLFAAIALFLLLKIIKRPIKIAAWPRVFLLGLLQTGVFSALIQLALISGAAGKTSILVYTMPFWVIAMAWLAFSEKIQGTQWLALIMAGIGLVLILQPWQKHDSYISEILAISAGFCWALSAIVAKWIKRDYEIEALSLSAWQMLFGALALCLATFFVDEPAIKPTPYFFGALFYNAVLATALAWSLWFFALQHLSTGVAGMATLGVPIVGAISGWVELGERPASLELVGMIAVALALLVISLRALKSG